MCISPAVPVTLTELQHLAHFKQVMGEGHQTLIWPNFLLAEILYGVPGTVEREMILQTILPLMIRQTSILQAVLQVIRISPHPVLFYQRIMEVRMLLLPNSALHSRMML